MAIPTSTKNSATSTKAGIGIAIILRTPINPAARMRQAKNTPMLGVFRFSPFCSHRRCAAQATTTQNSWRRHPPAPRKAGLSQEKLAEKADLHPVYIGKIERGEQWISLHALLRVAKALGVKASDLIDEL